MSGDQFANDAEYSKYLLDLLTKIQKQIKDDEINRLMKSRPEMEVTGPKGTGSTLAFAPGAGTDTPEGKEMARADEKIYTTVNHVMPQWFTKLDNKVRKTDKKLQKYDGRKLANKIGGKVRKKLKKVFGF